MYIQSLPRLQFFCKQLLFLLLAITIVFKYADQATAKDSKPPTATSFSIRSGVTVAEHTLGNNLKVILIKNPAAPLTSVYHWVKAGSIHETRGITGIAHLFEHMMFRPIKNNKLSFSQQVAPLGAEINATTRFESTVYTTTLPQKHLKNILELEANRFQNMHVTDELLNIERQAVHSEYSTGLDTNPSFELWYLIYQTAFPKHPLGWHIVGFREDLEKITATDCNRFFKQLYNPNNTVLIVGGDIDLKETLSWIKKYYGSWKTGNTAPQIPEFQNNSTKTVSAVGKLESNSKTIAMGYRVPFVNSSNASDLNLLSSIFWESDYSLAKRRFVIDRQLVSEISGDNFSYDNALFKVIALPLAGVSKEQILEHFKLLSSDFKNLSPDDFLAYIKEYKINFQESLLRNEHLVQIAGLSWGKYGGSEYLLKMLSQKIEWNKKKLDDFVDQYFTPENLVFVESKGAWK